MDVVGVQYDDRLEGYHVSTILCIVMSKCSMIGVL